MTTMNPTIPKLHLAMETSGRVLSTAIFRGDELLCRVDSQNKDNGQSSDSSSAFWEPRGGTEVSNQVEEVCPPTKKQRLRQMPGISVTLFPMLQQLLSQQQTKMSQIDLISLNSGPGSFTGLRAAVVAAKTMAYALKIPVVTVNALDVIAHQTVGWLNSLSHDLRSPRYSSLKVAINAQRNQLFTAAYRIDSLGSDDPLSVAESAARSLNQEGDFQLLNRDQWMQQIQPTDLISGGGLSICGTDLKDYPCRMAAEVCWNADAISVGRLAWKKFLMGHADDIWSLDPIYFRPSYAEEKSRPT